MSNNSQTKPNIILLVVTFLLLGVTGFLALPLLKQLTLKNTTAFPPSSNPPATTVSNPNPSNSDLENDAKSYELLLKKDPNNPLALRGLLDTRLQQGNLKLALVPLEKLAQTQVDKPEYRLLLAQTKNHLKDFEGSAQAYRLVLKNDPGNVIALQGMVNLLLQQNRPEGAIGLLQDTLKLASQQPDKKQKINVTSIQLILGQIYVNQQRFTEALTVYEQAASNNKQDFRPVLAQAMILQQQGKDNLAKPLFTKATALAPAKYRDQIKQMANPTIPTKDQKSK